jgi:hypothetical protein
MRNTPKFLRHVLAAAVLAGAALPASALSVFTLNVPGGLTFGTVSLTQVDADTVNVNVVLTTGYKFNEKTNQESFDFNLEASLVGRPTLTFNSPTEGYSLVDGTFQGGGFGKLDYGLDCRGQVRTRGAVTTTGCTNAKVNSLDPNDAIDFDVNLAGIGESSFIANTQGYYFTALVNYAEDAAFVVGSNMAPIPEPETYALMLAGLGVVGFMARRRKAN